MNPSRNASCEGWSSPIGAKRNPPEECLPRVQNKSRNQHSPESISYRSVFESALKQPRQALAPKQGWKKPYEKGLAIHSAPSFALGTARCTAKRKQGDRWGGGLSSSVCFRQVCATRVVLPSKAISDSRTISLNAASTSKGGNPCHRRRHSQTHGKRFHGLASAWIPGRV